MQSLNKNGVSITQTPGEEKFVKCRLSAFKGHFTSTITAIPIWDFSAR